MKTLGKISVTAFLLAVVVIFSFGPCFAGDNIEDYRARVNQIAEKVAASAGIDVNIVVTPEYTIDACVYPDGTIVITSGLIKASKSDDEVAFVVGHEISHIVVKDFSNKSIPAIINYKGLPRHLSRELNADLRGMYYAEKAGYNPYASVKILTRIATDFDAFFERRIEAISHYLKNSFKLSETDAR